MIFAGDSFVQEYKIFYKLAISGIIKDSDKKYKKQG